jgi:LPXTG-motif cell wall-anchored protein
MLLATHGWWPWLLTLAILIVAVYLIFYFVKRRKAV